MESSADIRQAMQVEQQAREIALLEERVATLAEAQMESTTSPTSCEVHVDGFQEDTPRSGISPRLQAPCDMARFPLLSAMQHGSL